jgi:hypothetical protein
LRKEYLARRSAYLKANPSFAARRAALHAEHEEKYEQCKAACSATQDRRAREWRAAYRQRSDATCGHLRKAWRAATRALEASLRAKRAGK